MNCWTDALSKLGPQPNSPYLISSKVGTTRIGVVPLSATSHPWNLKSDMLTKIIYLNHQPSIETGQLQTTTRRTSTQRCWHGLTNIRGFMCSSSPPRHPGSTWLSASSARSQSMRYGEGSSPAWLTYGLLSQTTSRFTTKTPSRSCGLRKQMIFCKKLSALTPN